MIEIVPFSGIQILDFELDLSTVDAPRKHFAITDEQNLVLLNAGQTTAHRDQFSEKYSSVINDFQEQWLPAPIFKFAGTRDGSDTFEAGPTTWARMRIKIKSRSKEGEIEKVICQIAMDTTIDLDNNPRLSSEDYYLMPSNFDLLGEKEFGFVSSASEMYWFLESVLEDEGEDRDTQKWVTEWISEALLEGGAKPQRLTRNKSWAKYFTLVEIFGNLNIPRIKLLDTYSPNNSYTPIPTDFVIDLGNSRTCGILLEKPETHNIQIESAIPFKIRDFENAHVYESGLIESRIELAQANFGRYDLARKSGRHEAFLWPSPARIGSEAQSIQNKTDGTEAPSGLSSSKRYLCETSLSEREWRFADTKSNIIPPVAKKSKYILNQQGEIRGAQDPPTTELKFSKSSFVMFMIAELIAHAFVQINNPQERKKRPNATSPRRLSRIILTIPTATPAFEQHILRKRAKDALDYVWEMMGLPSQNGILQKPDLFIDWDEASCSQQVFLFNEVSETYRGQASNYFLDYGKLREFDGIKKNSLKIASVDIGGGTTDLMITSYTCEAGDVIHPLQEFREGFRIAGDDIVFALIKDGMLPIFEKFLRDEGGQNVDVSLANFFKTVQDSETQLKSTFTNSVLVPIAIKIMKLFESEELAYADFTRSKVEINNNGVFDKMLDQIAKNCGIDQWPEKSLNIRISKGQYETCIDNILSKVIKNISIALNNFDCDYVLLTGRPSKQPYVRKLFENAFILPPHRLISLHDYPVGSWYPFRDPLSGKIGDPKSTVVVGALLNSVSSRELTNYSFKSEKLLMKTTANFIGEMETSGQIKDDKIIIDNVANQNQEEFEFKFFNPIHIGSRQINDELWTTSPLYRLSLSSPDSNTVPMPLRVVLSRNPDAFDDDPYWSASDIERMKELIKIEEIEDSDGKRLPIETLNLSFNTLGKLNNYWLETGLFM